MKAPLMPPIEVINETKNAAKIGIKIHVSTPETGKATYKNSMSSADTSA
jgi:hypothetical protein